MILAVSLHCSPVTLLRYRIHRQLALSDRAGYIQETEQSVHSSRCGTWHTYNQFFRAALPKPPLTLCRSRLGQFIGWCNTRRQPAKTRMSNNSQYAVARAIIEARH